MKKSICMILILSVLSSLIFTVGVTASYETVRINGIMYMSHDTYCSAKAIESLSGEITIPSTVNFSGTDLPVTEIETRAFDNCTAITAINLPDTVLTIDSSAFYDCSNLSRIVIPSGVTEIGSYAFAHCYSIESIRIPDSVSKIGTGAFYYCDSLSSLIIGRGVTDIGVNILANCTALSSVIYVGTEEKWNSSVTVSSNNDNLLNHITYHAEHVYDDDHDLICNVCGAERHDPLLTFESRGTYYELTACAREQDGTVNIPSTATINDITLPVKAIGEKAFRYCSDIVGVIIPDSVTTIGEEAFANCISLRNVVMPDGLTTIGDYAFYGCSSISDLVIPDSVTSLGAYAFYGCEGLQNITIGSGITKISSGAFGSCINLAGVSIPNNVKIIGDYAFYDCEALTSVTVPVSVTAIGLNAFAWCTGLQSAVIGDGVKEIGVNAFWGCTDLQNVIIGGGVTDIKDFAFYNCSSLESITIPDNVENIGSGAFEYCTGLTSAAIGDGVTDIGDYAFYGCSLLSDVYIGDSVSEIGKHAFGDCSAVTSVEYGKDQSALSTIAAENEGNDAVLISITPHAEHSFGNWITDDSPTSSSAGHKHRACESCGFTENAVILPDVQFSNVSVTLKNKIDINFKVNKSLFINIGYSEPYAVFEFDGKQITVTDYESDEDQYVFRFCDITPDKMTDSVKVTLYTNYGEEEHNSAETSYSVADYCYEMLAETTSNDGKLRTLLVDMLRYGAAAQIYTGRNADDLADKYLTQQQLAWGTKTGDLTLVRVTDPHYEQTVNREVIWKSVGLILTDSVTVRYTFSADDVNGLTLVVKDGNDAVLGVIDEFTGSNGTYTAKFDGLNVTQMSEKLFITACRNEQPVSNTMLYNVESYAYSMQNVTENNLGDLVIAMMKYGKAAYAYSENGG